MKMLLTVCFRKLLHHIMMKISQENTISFLYRNVYKVFLRKYYFFFL